MKINENNITIKKCLLEEFGIILDCCDLDVRKCSVKEEQSYGYAIFRVYCKAILTCKEIFCLLTNGFPDGSMALSRQLFEAWVITRRLLQGHNQQDDNLLERFFDSIQINDLKQADCILEYVLSHYHDNNEAQDKLNQVHRSAMHFQNKYQKSTLKAFNDYWWTGFGSFRDLREGVGLTKDYMFPFSSNRVHFNITSIFEYMDQSESGIGLGPSEEGWKTPLQFTVLCFRMIDAEIHSAFPDYCSQITLDRINAFTEIIR